MVSADCEPHRPHARLTFYMPRCVIPGDRDSGTTRKNSHDKKSHLDRIDNDAGCDLRTGVCGHGRTERALLARSDWRLRPASGPSLQCFRSGNGGADGGAQRVPLSWRTEIERLTFDVLDTGSRQLVRGHFTPEWPSFLTLRI